MKKERDKIRLAGAKAESSTSTFVGRGTSKLKKLPQQRREKEVCGAIE